MDNVGMYIFGSFIAIWKIFTYGYFVYFVVIWYIASHFDMLYQEKSGNLGPIESRVARYFLTKYTKTGENIPYYYNII
jgi:hypothetical protein